MAKAMLIDTSRCMACRGCQVACKQWNDLGVEPTKNLGSYENPPHLSAATWTHVRFREKLDGDQIRWLFLAYGCMHCTEASCVSVCPTGAAAHHGEFVVIDQEWCIGCGYCVAACPFDAVHSLSPGQEKATARKCTFCIDRVTNGLIPACAKTCPAGAFRFGDRDDLVTFARQRVEVLRANGRPRARLYGENELGGLHRMYVLTDEASAYGLPEAPRLATTNILGQWLSGIVTAGVIAVLPFWLLFRRKEELAAEKSSERGEKR